MNSAPPFNLADDPYLALRTPPSVTRPLRDRLQFALQAAVLAPSIHNVQPWRFRLHEGPYVDLLLDGDRALPSLDPTHRQLIISCGAALAAYEIGLLGCGLGPDLELFPDPAEPACLARVRVRGLEVRDPVAYQKWQLLADRRSYRGPMTSRVIDQSLRGALMSEAGPSTIVHFVPTADWRSVERIIADGTLVLAESDAVTNETRSWTRGAERSRDGVPAANWLRTSEEATFAPVVQRDFAQGRPLPDGDRPRAVEADPQLVVLFTDDDSPFDWLTTGMSLMRMALFAHSKGLALGYVNQPVEVAGLRDRLANLLAPGMSHPQVPQIVLRLGYPANPLPPATPRRRVKDVLEKSMKGPSQCRHPVATRVHPS